ncbi:MAG TPA: transglutaminase-like domain-containing protein [Acidimicrobiales bacterium]|nr:transglutaminase-like domain-containing protein [Acidimicrobiales bacterium]
MEPVDPSAPGDLADRFAGVASAPEDEVRLDLALLLIAAAARPGVDVDANLAVLDDLAARCPAPTLDALVRHLFVEEGFTGNRDAYYDARNSYLDQVLERRLGIPITLAVVVMAVGRRLGVPVAGVSMPGHFLLRDRVDRDVFVDPFRGALLDRAGCEAVFRALHGPGAAFHPAFLAPVGAWTVLRRVLANLAGVHRAEGDRGALARVLQLRAAVPGVTGEERRELADALAAAGAFGAAAATLEALAGGEDPGQAQADLNAATRYRARLN